MVCKKMYGGGMGDQIRRYCDEMEADVINFLSYQYYSHSYFNDYTHY